MLASLVAPCRRSDVNPVDFIAATLRAIPDGHPKGRSEDRMPRRFHQPSSLAPQGSAVALANIEAILQSVNERQKRAVLDFLLRYYGYELK